MGLSRAVPLAIAQVIVKEHSCKDNDSTKDLPGYVENFVHMSSPVCAVVRPDWRFGYSYRSLWRPSGDFSHSPQVDAAESRSLG